MEFLIFAGIVLGALIVVAGIIWLAKKFNVKDKELDFAKLVLEVVDYVNKVIPEWRFSGALTDVIKYAKIAVDIAKQQDEITNLVDLRKFAFEQAKLICSLNEIEVDEDFLRLLGGIIDALVAKE